MKDLLFTEADELPGDENESSFLIIYIFEFNLLNIHEWLMMQQQITNI